jgi:hypothetical protein
VCLLEHTSSIRSTASFFPCSSVEHSPFYPCTEKYHLRHCFPDQWTVNGAPQHWPHIAQAPRYLSVETHGGSDVPSENGNSYIEISPTPCWKPEISQEMHCHVTFWMSQNPCKGNTCSWDLRFSYLC